MYHMAELWNWVSTLVVGGTHVMLPAFDPRSMFDAIATHQVTATLVVPTMIQLMVDHPEIGKYNLLEWLLASGCNVLVLTELQPGNGGHLISPGSRPKDSASPAPPAGRPAVTPPPSPPPA
jgi:hypothetical protein